MGLVIRYVAGMIDWRSDHFSERLLYLMAAVASGVVVYVVACYAAGVTEVRSFIRRILDRGI